MTDEQIQTIVNKWYNQMKQDGIELNQHIFNATVSLKKSLEHSSFYSPYVPQNRDIWKEYQTIKAEMFTEWYNSLNMDEKEEFIETIQKQKLRPKQLLKG